MIRAAPHPQDPGVVVLTCEEREPIAEALGIEPRRAAEGWRVVVDRSKLAPLAGVITWPARKRRRFLF